MPRELFTSQLAFGDFPLGMGGLQSTIGANYSIARAYYQQRETAFERAMGGKVGAVKEYYRQCIQQATNKWLSAVKSDFYSVLNNAIKGKTIGRATANRLSDLTYKASLDQLVKEFLTTDTNGVIRQKGSVGWGVMLEEWMVQRLSGPDWAQRISDMAKNTASSLMQMYAFGKQGQASAVTAGVSRETRTDVYMGTKSANNVGQIELTAWLDFDTLDTKLTQVEVVSTLMEAIKEVGTDTTIYGFQVKAYLQGSDSMRWSNSQTLINQLNMIFHNDRWWSLNYAGAYPFYYLSKYILNIVNPVNIGVITPRGLEYMSDFLSHYQFYVEVAPGELNGEMDTSERGGGAQTKNPTAVGNQILTRAIGNGGMLSAAGTVLSTQGQGKWANKALSTTQILNMRYS